MVFTLSAFLPLITAGAFGFNVSVSLVDFYRIIGYLTGQSGESVPGWSSTIPLPTNAYTALIGILLTLILYPITTILGFISIAKQRVSLAAGILGIVCWACGILTVASLQSLIGPFGSLVQYGVGIFVGFVGSVIFLVAHFLKPTKTVSQSVPPPPPPLPSPPS